MANLPQRAAITPNLGCSTRARETRARRDLERKARLAAGGFVALADLDRTRADQEVAAREAEAQERRIAALRAQAAGLRQGIFLDAGHSGAAYAAQRLDEVALRLVETGRSIAALEAEAEALAVQLRAEEQRSDRLRRADLPAPASGTLWRVLAQGGERLAPGDPVAEVVDCSAAFLLAALPQDQTARVRLGGAARIRLSGETGERHGKVQAILGEAPAGQDGNLAALPSRPRAPSRWCAWRWNPRRWTAAAALAPSGAPRACSCRKPAAACSGAPWPLRRDGVGGAGAGAAGRRRHAHGLRAARPRFAAGARARRRRRRGHAAALRALALERPPARQRRRGNRLVARLPPPGEPVDPQQPPRAVLHVAHARPVAGGGRGTEFAPDRGAGGRVHLHLQRGPRDPGAQHPRRHAIAHPDLRVWVLDDGARDWVRALAADLGARYLSRVKGRHAKAGNVNNGLRHALSTGRRPEFVLLLDADFVPARRILRRTLPLFAPPDVGIVQTPQHFFNADPLQRNLLATRTWPDEQRFFFNVLLPCKDAWGAAFCCGTSAVLRVAALEAAGGMATETVTEDMLTTFRMEEHGWRTVFLNERLSLGLAPEGLAEYVTQRSRWCLGTLQQAYTRWSFLGRGRVGLMNRVSAFDASLYWSVSFLFRLSVLVGPLLY
jgi:biotin carboxyl carrier protein